ncbi:MAG: hypothetical protein U0838_13010 [Chloroflexota bacterium]
MATAAATSAAFTVVGGVAERAVGWLEESVGAAEDEAAANAKMRTALEANVPAWDGNTEAINRRIDAATRLGFTDDDARDSFTRLVAATHDVNRAFEVQQTAMGSRPVQGDPCPGRERRLIKVRVPATARSGAGIAPWDGAGR